MATQSTRCVRRDTVGRPPCFVCRGLVKGLGENCRFRDFRKLHNIHKGLWRSEFGNQECVDSPTATAPTTFHAYPSVAEIVQLQNELAPLIHPMLLEMRVHDRLPDLIRRQPDLRYRLICDHCLTSILSCSFFCTECGYEICRRCHAEHGIKIGHPCRDTPAHEGHCFRPVSRIDADYLELTLAQVDRVIARSQEMQVEPPSTNDTARFQVCATYERKVPVLQPGQDHLFRSLWCLDIPIVVEGLHCTMQGSWSPEAIVRTHGAQAVTMFKSGGKASEKVSVARFFQEFAKTDTDRGYAVKLKDWPPSTSFERDFKQNYNAFMQSVPMPSYTRHDGVRNLIAHYAVPPHPLESLKPDVGPKVYIATPDIPREGSTRLHIDVTCAVNILAWCASGDPNLPAAEWLVFEPKDLEELRRYLRSKQDPDEAPRDPVHAQQTYVTEAMVVELRARGIRPYKISQRLGDAVFIPAGAAHQVSNVQACIKVACDFLCVEGVIESAKVSADFRREQMPEVLPLETVLWDAWISLAYHAEQVEARPRSVALTRTQRKNKRQRETPRAQEDYGRRKQLRRHPSETAASTGYRCPHVGCTARHRRFPTLVGVFTHINDKHHIAVPQAQRELFSDLHDAEFEELFREVFGSLA